MELLKMSQICKVSKKTEHQNAFIYQSYISEMDLARVRSRFKLVKFCLLKNV